VASTADVFGLSKDIVYRETTEDWKKGVIDEEEITETVGQGIGGIA